MMLEFSCSRRCENMKKRESLLDKVGYLMPRLRLPEKTRFDPAQFINTFVEGRLWTEVEMIMFRSLVTIGAMVKEDIRKENLEADTVLPGLAQADPKDRTRLSKRLPARPKDERHLRRRKVRKGLRNRRNSS